MNPIHIFSKRYLIHEQLGAGGEGVIFRATDRLTAKTVAIKRVRLEQEAEQISRSSYRTSADRKFLIANEFQTLASLRHPNIISVLNYGFGTEAGENVPYFVMEYLPEAKTILEEGEEQPLETQIGLLIQMLQALHYLHQRGILHRDLKPANALIVEGRLKLLDFGLSAYVGKAQGTSGTLPYMPPEYMQDEPLSPASDLYSVGIIGYELLAGRHPYDMDDPSQLVMDILFREPDFDEIRAPQDFIRILEKLLAKTPGDRFQNAYDVILAFSAALGQSSPPETEAIRESFLRQASFVGREAEMKKLVESLEGLRLPNTPTPRAWLIGGESGVGKSRLLSEFRAHALVRGAIVLQGRSFASYANPYHLWDEPLQALAVLTQLDVEQASVLKAIVPDIERVLPGMPFILDAMPLEGRANKYRMLAVLRNLFEQLTKGESNPVPVILILEDVHYAGSESLELLRDIQEIVADFPIMMLATYHSDEAPTLHEQFANFDHVRLPRLGEAEVVALSTAMLGDSNVDSQLIQLLFRETEGNVLFLIESIRALAEETGRLSDIGKLDLPTSIRAAGVEALLVKRLERVPDDARQLLSFAAILGRKLDPTLLLHHWFLPMSWEQWLLKLSNSAIIHLINDTQWAFAHEKLREVVVAQLSTSRRKELHARAAQTIETLYPDTPNYYWKLVFHWREAEELDREFAYLSLAGTHLLRTSAYREALECYQRGLSLITSGKVQADAGNQAEFLIKQASALASLGDYEASNQVYQAALAFSQEYNVDKGVADGYYGLAKNYDALGNYREAQNFYGWALTLYEKLTDAKGAAHTRMGLGRVANRLSAFEEAKQAFQTSLAIFRQLDEKQGEGSVLSGLGDIARVQGEFELSEQYYLEALKAYQTIGNREGTSMAFNNLGVLNEIQGLCEEAIVWHQKSLEIKREIGNRQGIAISLSNIGVAYYSLNNFEVSRQYAEETAAIYRAMNDQQGMADTFNNLGLLDIKMQDFAQAQKRLSKALQLFEQIGDQWGVALAHLNLGKVARESIADKVAVQHFTEAIEIAQILKLDSVCLQTVIEHVPILMRTGAEVRAVVHLVHAYQNPKTPAFERNIAVKLLEESRNHLSQEQFEEAVEEGESLTLDDILRFYRN